MLGITRLKRSVFGLVALASVSVSFGAIASSKIEFDASLSITKADAILQQKMDFDVHNGSVEYSITTQQATLKFSMQENESLMESYKDVSDHIKVFKGTIEGNPDGWIRLVSYHGKNVGAYFDGENLVFIDNYESVAASLEGHSVRGMSEIVNPADESISVLVNAADMHGNGICGSHDHIRTLNDVHLQDGHDHSDDFSYDGFVSHLADMVGRDGARKRIDISLFADTQFVAAEADATATMINYLNIADGVFSEQVGVSIKLNGVTELTDNGTLTPTDANLLIREFRSAGLPNPGVSHLFTGRNLNGSTVGIAYVGSLCRSSSVGITQRYGTKTALIFVHELGHNFGAPHDNQSNSACSSVSSGYVMNPNVGGSSLTFSQCSLDQMVSTIDYATNGSRACITVEAGDPPQISSTPNANVKVGEQYNYDDDSKVDVTGSNPFTYALQNAPAGMTIGDDGTISWTPIQSQVGVNAVEIVVTNSYGSDTQSFNITVEDVTSNGPVEYINFNETTLSSFSDIQDVTKDFSIEDGGYQLTMPGNAWKKIPFDYEITPDTMLTFKFTSTQEGEIHAVGFTQNEILKNLKFFQVFGTQKWAPTRLEYTQLGETVEYVIPIGEVFTGDVSYMVFAMDNDVPNPQSISSFKDVAVYEKGQETPPDPEPPTPSDPNYLDLSLDMFIAHQPGHQDRVGTVSIIENGKGVELTGNKWQRLEFPDRAITPNTVIRFEFKTSTVGEIYGIGVFNYNYSIKNNAFQVAGTENWATHQLNYTGNGDWQVFEAPIGEYYTANKMHLVFINDDDKNSAARSSFRNIKIYEK